jgi:hypothetical protein
MSEGDARGAEQGRGERQASGDSLGTVAALAGVPRMLGGALADIRTIARGMQVLPELARTLAAIERRVDSLDDEVRTMRRAVESMDGDVKELPARIDQVQHALSPLRRIGRRFGRQPTEDAGPE